MVFMVDLTGPQIIGKPGYKWTVSTGSIVSGQGTRSVTVSTTKADEGLNITATVMVEGILPACTNTASETAPVAPAFGCGMPFDEYGKARWNEEKARLDNVQIQLNNNPDQRLFIYLRITSDESFDLTRKHAKKMIKHFLWRDKEFDVSRVAVVMYVDDDHSTVLDLVPAGSKPRLCETGCIELSGSDLLK
jgi:hypothetical protein